MYKHAIDTVGDFLKNTQLIRLILTMISILYLLFYLIQNINTVIYIYQTDFPLIFNLYIILF